MRIGVLVVGGVREWRRAPKIGVLTHLRPMGPSVIADLDTLLIALYVELTDQIIPTRPNGRRAGPGRPPALTDAELVCLAVAQVLLRYDDEHHWLRAAPARVGHLFPRLLSQPAYNRRLRAAAWLPEAALRWLADHTPATAERLRLLDGTPVSCGRSRTTTTRSGLAGWAGYGHDTSHHCCYWGSRLLLVTTPEGTVTGFGLANPKLLGEREAVVAGSKRSRPTGPDPARCWWPTRALPAATSRPPWPAWSLASCARPAPTSPTLGASRTGCGSGSRRSSGRSSTSSAWTDRAAASQPDCGPGSPSACSPATP
jgi:hypothetical protein